MHYGSGLPGAGLLILFSLVASLILPPLAMAAGEVQTTRQTVELKTRYGTVFDAYVAGPVDAAGGVLLVPGLTGMDGNLAGWVDALGALGYRVIATGLYDGRPVRTLRMAQQVRQDTDPVWMEANVQGGIDRLSGKQQRLAVMVFDQGTELAGKIQGMTPSRVAAWISVAAASPIAAKAPVLRLGHARPTRDAVAAVGDFLGKTLSAR